MSNPRYDWWGYVKGMIRRYPDGYVNEKEAAAVKSAIENTSKMNNGDDRLKIVDLVFWKRTHTLPGAAMQIPCSERTAQEWHRQFIRLVAKNFGLID